MTAIAIHRNERSSLAVEKILSLRIAVLVWTE